MKMQLRIECTHEEQMKLCTAFHQQFKRLSDCQLPTAHSLTQNVQNVHQLQQNDTTAKFDVISTSSRGKLFHIVNKK